MHVRGAVFRYEHTVLRSGGGFGEAPKYLILLQTPTDTDVGATQAAYVIASTRRTGGAAPRSFEVVLDESDGFHHPTIVDGRWVYTLPRSELGNQDYQFALTDDRVAELSVAVFIGLQLQT